MGLIAETLEIAYRLCIINSIAFLLFKSIAFGIEFVCMYEDLSDGVGSTV